LLRDAEQFAKYGHFSDAMRLEVSVRNRPAIAMYEKSGYHRIGRHRAYYPDDIDAWRMQKAL